MGDRLGRAYAAAIGAVERLHAVVQREVQELPYRAGTLVIVATDRASMEVRHSTGSLDSVHIYSINERPMLTGKRVHTVILQGITQEAMRRDVFWREVLATTITPEHVIVVLP